MGQDRPVIKMSVRNLVEFIFQSGDIDRRRRGKEADAMAAGSRIHRKLQRSMGGGYQAEVSLKLEEALGPGLLRLEGRADGIFQEDGQVWIDEIKGMYRDVARMEEPVFVHKAQAMCYAYIYGRQEGLGQIGVRMTYVNLETEIRKYFRELFTFGQLAEWFESVKTAYEKWAVFQWEHQAKRDRTIKEAVFPYPYREGQRRLAAAVYRSVADKKNLMIQAATGIGKTLAVLFPAVKAMGEGLTDKLFYMTAKTITRTVAEQSLHILCENGLWFSSVTLTAREKICPFDQAECNPAACERARGHFDRVNEAVYDLIVHEGFAGRQTILDYGEKHQVCPFELSLDTAYWMDMIICDYNYAFDPDAYLRRFFGEGVAGHYLFLVDEAHNLVDRAREMYSAAIDKEDFLETRKLLKEKHPKIARQLNRCNQLLLELKRECDDYAVQEQLSQLVMPFSALYTELEVYLEESGELAEPPVLDFYFKLRSFLNIYDIADENYRFYTAHKEDGRFMVKQLCINPAKNLQERLSKGVSAVFFSATLLPVGYYKELLTGNQEEYAIYAESPFPKENRLICVAEDVSSRYARRGKRSYEKVWRYVEEAVKARPGNYLVFFPSYQFMEQVAACGGESATAKTHSDAFRLVLQSGNMDEKKREAFLENFRPDNQESVVGFCVMGGIFSEGIDLKGEALVGALIVGTGLPLVCAEREIIRQHYDAKADDHETILGSGNREVAIGRSSKTEDCQEGEDEKKQGIVAGDFQDGEAVKIRNTARKQTGFDYAYRFPGMNKVLQAAGRVVRTAEDKGVILLLDDRFTLRENRLLFPREWEHMYRVNISNVGNVIRRFWESGSADHQN